MGKRKHGIRRGKPAAAGPALEGREQRQTLDRLTDEIIRAKGHAAVSLYEMGVRLDRIGAEQLWRAGSYHHFDDYLARAVDLSRSTAYRCMRFARHFNREICLRYGVDKLEAIVRYERATPDAERPGDLLAAVIRLRSDSGRFVTKRLHEASAREISEAVTLAEDAKTAGHRLPRSMRVKLERLVLAMPPAPRGLASRNRARLSRGKDGRLALSVSAIPLDQLEAFMTALKKTLL